MLKLLYTALFEFAFLMDWALFSVSIGTPVAVIVQVYLFFLAIALTAIVITGFVGVLQ